MKTRSDNIKTRIFHFFLPFAFICIVAFYLYYKDPKLLAPVLTPLVALVAFFGQQQQLKMQKEDANLTRFTDVLFRLIEIHNNNVQDLKYQDPVNGKHYQGRGFVKKAYRDLMIFYSEIKQESKIERPFKESMEALDRKYKDNLHLYFKNLFQVFGWIYDHRQQMTKEQVTLYVNVIRSQLSLNEMMILYMNTSYVKRSFFYKILQHFDFFDKYNTDKFGKGIEGIEKQFMHDVEELTAQKTKTIPKQQLLVPPTHTKEELLAAIENGGIGIHYQPIVEVSHGEMVAAEALIRWKKGVYPTDLMDQFEYYGLTYDILTYILRCVCQQIKKVKLPITYSVNLSLHQLLLSDFLDIVDEMCRKYRVPPERLQFELTEHKALYEREQIKKVFSDLRDKGFHVGIDDFGSGYFSFYDFVDLPINFVKLDKQIVHKLDEQHDHQKEMASHIVEMARTKNLHVTVEGIETNAQCNNWKDMNIDTMQGYLFSKAVEHNELKRLRKTNMFL